MKNIMKLGLLGISAMALLASCQDTLDTHPSASFDEVTVWSSKATADAFVNQAYSSVINNCLQQTRSTNIVNNSGITWECRTPNCLRASQVGEGIDGLATELGVTNATDFGSNRSALLRQCNMIIEKAEASEMAESDKKDLVAQGRFLRGVVFFDQARKMGRFVPLCKVLDAEDEAGASIAMTKDAAESYKYVVADLEYAAQNLPETAAAGRANRAAANIILSRACLQAYAYTKDASYLTKAVSASQAAIASGSLTTDYADMFNNPTSTNSEIQWAVYRVNSNSTVGTWGELQLGLPNISNDDARTSGAERLFVGATKTFECWGIFWPTQDLVDHYLVIDEATGEALPWYETSQYKNNVEEKSVSELTTAGCVDSYPRTNGDERRIPSPQDLSQVNPAHPQFTHYGVLKAGVNRTISDIMYSNRDARFAANLAYDQCADWNGEPVDMNLGGNMSAGVRDKEDGGWYNTTTNYYFRKYIPADFNKTGYNFNYGNPADTHICLARIGEAYLNLAEALLLQGKTADAVAALNNTRTVHGQLPASKATTEADAWADYIRERNCEMVEECGDLYFSYLRWGKYGGHANHGRTAGDIVYDLDRPPYKIEISHDRTKFIVCQATLQNGANRTFTTKRYLLPIAQGFLDTREAYGLDHTQNPGW